MSKLVGGVFLDSYCKLVHLFWDHYLLKPRTRVSILVIYWRVKTGRGGVLLDSYCKLVHLFFWCPKYQLLLMFYWYFDHFGSPLWGPWGCRPRPLVSMCNSRRRWICRAAGGLAFHLLYIFCFVFLCGAIVYCPFVVYCFVLFFFVVLLCIVLRSICPSPPLEAGD